MAVTDYSTECGSLPLSFIQMLASTIVGYHDIAGVLHYRINGVETADVCTELSDFLECDVSHIDPERQLVENTFGLDDCSRLIWKIFHNSDTHWTDYGVCNEIPQTFIQLLARCIVNYSDVSKVNAVIDAGACTGIDPLLVCSSYSLTEDVAEEALRSAFATDDCNRLLIKFFANTSTMTDYHTECVELPQTFYQLLARCLVVYDSHVYINTATVTGYCDDLHDFWTCANNHIDPERALVENVFAVDDCGILALKIFNNEGDSREQ
jgi:hypothetical protein